MTDVEAAIRAARAAGSILTAHEDAPLQVRQKGAVDLVTEVDLACEHAIRSILSAHSDLPILGEEEGGPQDADTAWIVDPLDGTTNFVHGFPYYAVSIALKRDGRLELGVVYDPLRDRLYRATRGQGAWCNQRKMAVSRRTALHEALIGTGFAYDRRERSAFYLSRFERVLRSARGIRRAGAAALDLAMVADGKLDAFWEFGLKPWDVAAGIVLIEEAGGRVTTHNGEDIRTDLGAPLASNGHLHDAMQPTHTA